MSDDNDDHSSDNSQHSLDSNTTDMANNAVADSDSEENEDTGLTATQLANNLANIKARRNVSQRAVEDIVALFVKNINAIKRLKDNGEITASYINNIKKKAECHIPSIKCMLKIQKQNADGTHTIKVKRNLDRIPEKYLVQGTRPKYVVLNQAAATSLQEIKRHFKRLHPHYTEQEYKAIFAKTNMGIDGVRECISGARTFIIITIDLNGCLFLLQVHNYLKEHLLAKPTLDELIRHVINKSYQC